ncbi:MAG TPA: type II toxin-antitoxin system VapC family toxin [Candidatus Thiothrix moscowensis]|uniref:type II toxin-antitoxin system VapC family toxin n=1 Tax=unclassified Thiothrix TaxID=2636184 RepID=UPI0025DEE704|nr:MULTISPECIES: type II toxin-antitoxin system VapC family toxin [unclassified Thiothrix]HRJ53799.1 type II toxin-antitoxin system VapC family toxin [Candidatus Thiothrix moscowensis]HRJ93881.1 type II toxin-antitoxin system VapC family toxin [Candidatus Thiothrix moscowensis]
MTNYRYLLDTNIISSLYRQPHGSVYQYLQQVGESAVCTSIVVAAELRFGAQKKNSANLTMWVEQILASLDVLPLDAPADHAYAEVRTCLERTGQMIGANDLLIAAHALSLGLVIVTDNTGEFERVPGLSVENWLA